MIDKIKLEIVDAWPLKMAGWLVGQLAGKYFNI